MVIVIWSLKGGSGATVAAAGLAAVAAHELGRATLLVDLAGDLPAALGIDDAGDVGVHDWLATVRESVVESPVSVGGSTRSRAATASRDLAHLERPIDEHLSLIPAGSANVTITSDMSGEMLAKMLQADGRLIVVDAGTRPVPSGICAVDALIAQADRSLLVTRACYLALRRVSRNSRRIDGVILVEEPGRSLDATDVESVTSSPVVARVRCEPQIARTVDAGLLSSRLPRSMGRPFAGMLAS